MKQNKMEEQWLDEIRQTLADHEEELPADGWERLSAAMSSVEEVQPAVSALRSHIALTWLKRSAAAIVVGVIGAGSMYYFFDAAETTTPPVASDIIVETPSSTNENPNEIPIEIPSEIPSSRQQVLAKISASEQKIEPVKEQAKEEQKPQKTPTASESQQAPDPLPDMQQEENSILLAMAETPTKKPLSSQSWTVGVRLGRNGSSDFDFDDAGSGNYDGPTFSDPSYNSSNPIGSTPGAVAPEVGAPGVVIPDEVESSEHHLSWSAGISVSKQLNRYLWLESGSVYTYLSSEVTMKHSGRQHQQLHYLGIPLKLSVSITEEGRWRFYTSVGTMLEHSLYGKRGTKNLHLNDWQWSMDGGLGLQYKLADHMGLYVEPGVNYYFSNGSEVPSLRTESPFSLNLQIGIRFGL